MIFRIAFYNTYLLDTLVITIMRKLEFDSKEKMEK